MIVRGSMVLLELEGGRVADARVGTYGVVMLPPRFDDDVGFAARSEPLEAEALISKAAVERFVRAVLPRLTGIDDGRLDARVEQPLQDVQARQADSARLPERTRRDAKLKGAIARVHEANFGVYGVRKSGGSCSATKSSSPDAPWSG